MGYRKTCPRDRSTHGCSIVDAFYAERQSRRATIFMSWVWAYKAHEVLSGLRNWLSKSQVGQHHQFVWWCFFCNNQYALSKAEELSTSLAETFRKKLTEVGRMLINLDTLEEPKYLSRAWCIYENWVALQEGIPVEATLSDDGINAFHVHVKKGNANLERYLAFDSKRAKATMPEDTSYIQNAMEGKHDDVNRLVKAGLLDLVKKLSEQWAPMPIAAPARMKHMVNRLENAVQDAEHARAKDLILVVGNTGSGKSTLLNFLWGCRMLSGREKSGELNIYVDESHEKTPKARIGHTNMSETASPVLIEIDGQCFCDCPGFQDRSGADVSITNTVKVMHFVREAKSVKFLVLLDYSCIRTDRGIGFDQLFHVLHDMFGSPAQLAQRSNAILLCVTKAPRKFDDGVEVTRDTIVSSFKSLPELLNQFHDPDLSRAIQSICHQCIVYHPLGQAHSSWVQDRVSFLDTVKRLIAIQSSGEECLLVPNDHEMVTLRKMRLACKLEFEELLKESVDKASEVLATMKDLMKLLFETGLLRDQRMLDLHTEFVESRDSAGKKLAEVMCRNGETRNVDREEFWSFTTYIIAGEQGVLLEPHYPTGAMQRGDLRELSVRKINALIEAGKRVLFVSNSSLDRAAIARKHADLGIKFPLDQPPESHVISTAYACAQWLVHFHKTKPFVITSHTGLLDEFRKASITDYVATIFDDGTPRREYLERLDSREQVVNLVEKHPNVDAVVVGDDQLLSTMKIAVAALYIRTDSNINLITCATDQSQPLGPMGSEQGQHGALSASICQSLGKDPEKFALYVGKCKNPAIMLQLMATPQHEGGYAVDFASTVVIGDSLSTDIALASSGGMKSLLVFSGVTSREEYEKFKHEQGNSSVYLPTWICNTILDA